MRVVLGLVAATCAAPAAVAVLFAALFWQQAGWFEGQSWPTVADRIETYAAFAAVIAGFLTLVAGAPLAHHLASQGRRGVVRYAAAGIAFGAAPFLLFDGYIIGTNLLLDVQPAPDVAALLKAARWAGLGSWCGLWSATAYWALAIRRGAPST